MCITRFDSKVAKVFVCFLRRMQSRSFYRFYYVSALPFHNLFKVLLRLKQLVLLVVCSILVRYFQMLAPYVCVGAYIPIAFYVYVTPVFIRECILRESC